MMMSSPAPCDPCPTNGGVATVAFLPSVYLFLTAFSCLPFVRGRWWTTMGVAAHMVFVFVIAYFAKVKAWPCVVGSIFFALGWVLLCRQRFKFGHRSMAVTSSPGQPGSSRCEMSGPINFRRVAIIVTAVLIAGLLFIEPYIVLSNIYELFLTGVVFGVYAVLRRRGEIRHVCFTAVISAACAVLNPAVVHILFKVSGLPWVGLGGSELRSFGAGLVAVITGHVALVRIRRNHPPLRGRALAWVGLVLGYLWLAGWIALLLVFAGRWETGNEIECAR